MLKLTTEEQSPCSRVVHHCGRARQDLGLAAGSVLEYLVDLEAFPARIIIPTSRGGSGVNGDLLALAHAHSRSRGRAAVWIRIRRDKFHRLWERGDVHVPTGVGADIVQREARIDGGDEL